MTARRRGKEQDQDHPYGVCATGDSLQSQEKDLETDEYVGGMNDKDTGLDADRHAQHAQYLLLRQVEQQKEMEEREGSLSSSALGQVQSAAL